MRNPELTALVVDDNELDRRALRRSFRRFAPELHVVEADHGQHGLQLLRAGVGDRVVVVLDLRMPLMGGIEFLEEIRADDDLSRLPVIVFSTSSLDSDRRAAYERGAMAYVEKSDPGVHAGLARLLAAIQETVTLPS